MEDKSAVRIVSPHVDNAVFVMKWSGVADMGPPDPALPKQMLDWIVENTASVFQDAFLDLLQPIMMRKIVSTHSDIFRLNVEAETGCEVIRMKDTGRIIYRGKRIIAPIEIPKDEDV